MHEFSIVEELFRILHGVVTEQHLSSVQRVTVRIGELRQVVPELFTFAFDAAKAGTVLEEAVLEVQTVEASMRCEACGKTFDSPANGNVCPDCGSHELAVLQGKEIEIVSIEGEQE